MPLPLKPASTIQKLHTRAAHFPLRLARQGERVTIISVSGGRKFHERLAAVGLRVGAEVHILRNPMNGKLILGHQGTRLFLGGGMAHKIQVAVIQGADL